MMSEKTNQNEKTEKDFFVHIAPFWMVEALPLITKGKYSGSAKCQQNFMEALSGEVKQK
jgi:hypothetical protein